jgi:hypothetical protein
MKPVPRATSLLCLQPYLPEWRRCALRHANACVQDGYKGAASRWALQLEESLRECCWPPTAPPASPDAPQAAAEWQGFHAAPEASVAAMQNAFVALLELQGARGMRGAEPVATGGPWANPELRAVAELVAAPVAMLREAFLSGGPFDRADATAWVFQVRHMDGVHAYGAVARARSHD